MSSDHLSLQVEELGKRYLVPNQGDASSIARMMAHLKEFIPFIARNEKDYLWALKSLNFEVKKGEILGIIGKNGSGKSTLLKILSGITKPTTGRAVLKGRVASLLEVGTGFHPDLTGRENVFMSGVLLGISQQEIRAKFDQILDFSGIEPFIDMPVKRYSSGMYVRLAYAVASLLRTDILILDEVMAVGDVAFREKSQENMEKIANEGCTILFVSHNARAVTSICQTGMILDNGECIFQGSSKEAVARYLRKIHHFDDNEDMKNKEKCYYDLSLSPRLDCSRKVLSWISTHTIDGTQTNRFKTGNSMLVRIGYHSANVKDPYFSLLIQNEFAERVATVHSSHCREIIDFPEEGVIECRIDDIRLGEGNYHLMLDFGTYSGSRAGMISLDCVPNAARIQVDLNGYVGGIGLDAYQGAAHKSVWKYLIE